MTVEMRTMLRHKQHFILRNGLSYRKGQLCSHDQPSLQFLLPQNYREQAMKACHGNIGHLGLERPLNLLKDRFYWAGMPTDMKNHSQTCDRFLQFKSKPQKMELYPITTTHPLELVHMDFLTIESGKAGKDVNIIVVTDHFTCTGIHNPITDSTSGSPNTVGYALYALWSPPQILSNQGCNFESNQIAEVCEICEVKKLYTTPYRPQCNGQCKCFNTTLISMIGTLPKEAKINWQEQVPTLVNAYNCSHSIVTGFSPFYLMYGRHLMLPIEIKFGVLTPNIVASTSHGYIKKTPEKTGMGIQNC